MFGDTIKNLFEATILLLTTFMLLWCCQRPSEIDLNPQIRVLSEPKAPYLIQDSTIKMDVQVTALDGFQYFRIQEAAKGILVELKPSDFNSATVLDSIFYFPTTDYPLRDTIRYELVLADNKNRVSVERLNYVVSRPIKLDTITFYPHDFQDSLGNQLDSPSYVDFSNYSTFSELEASQNSALIDLGFTNDTRKWIIGSPSDSSFVADFIPSISSWPFRKKTSLFETDLNPEDFNSLENDGAIFESFTVNPKGLLKKPKKDDVFSFLTEDSIAGFGFVKKIDSLSQPNSIEIYFKVSL